MAFIFTCGTHIFQSQLAGFEHVTAQCQNCGNFSARVYKRWEWFTFCFIPIIPFSFKPWHEVGCHICNFYQDLKYRPDIQNSQGQNSHLPMQPVGDQTQSQYAPQPQPQYAPPPPVMSGGYGPPPGGPNGGPAMQFK